MRPAYGLVIAVLLVPSVSLAQPLREGAFGVQNFKPAPGPQNFLVVEGSRVGPLRSFSLGLTMNYADDPYVVYSASCPDDPTAARGQCPGQLDLDDEPIEVVSSEFTANLMAGFVPLPNLQVAIDLPIDVVSGESVDPESPESSGSMSTGGLGDPRFMGKYRFVGGGSGVGMAGSLSFTIPFAQIIGQDPDESHLGSDLPIVVPRIVADFRESGVEIAANLGVIIQSSSNLYDTNTGTSLAYGLAGAYQFTTQVRAIAELTGAAGFSSRIDEAPLEGDIAGQFRWEDFLFSAGGGVGILDGVGVPDYRLLLSALYSPVRGDLDGDGVDDRLDRCLDEPEDTDDFQDEDGCPEVDNDGDGFPDSSDRCPNDAEDTDEHQDQDGCPDLDNDGDGVQDGYDSCPNQPEDRDGDRDTDGCPDNDTDGDNISDAEDRCPADMEDTDGFEDEDGCPEPDNDQDGVLDAQDECGDEQEDRDGVHDEDGCPEEDDDGDGIEDARDKCPRTPGRSVWQGCATMAELRAVLRNPPLPPPPAHGPAPAPSPGPDAAPAPSPPPNPPGADPSAQ